MVWIKRNKPPEVHACQPPERPTLQFGEMGPPRPDGHPGDLWGCDHCGQVWEITYGLAWHKVSWWVQRKHHPRYTCGCKVGRNDGCPARRYRGLVLSHGRIKGEPTPAPTPPKGGGGVTRKWPQYKGDINLRTTAEAGADTSSED